MRETRHLCPLCEAGCGLSVTIDESDEVTLIRGDRDDVFSHGYLCPKGTALRGLQNDQDRLRHPLVKRNGSHVEVDFDEAFAEIDRRLQPVLDQHGRGSAGLVIGNPTVHRTGLVLYALDLAAALGSPNVFTAASLDQQPKQLAVGHMFGDFYSIPVPDIERTDLLVILGANPMVSQGSMWSIPDYRGKARAMQARGGRIITIDPRRTETAVEADDHLFVHPGADAFLLAAIVNTLFAEGLVSLGRLEPHLAGVDDVAKAVEPFTPAAVSGTTGIDSERITALARDLATTDRAVVYGRVGTCLQRHATVTSWLVDVVNALTGNLDEQGGSMFSKPPAFSTNSDPTTNVDGQIGTGAGITVGAYRSRVSGAPEIMNAFPMACLAEEIDTPGEGQIKALITLASNPALSAPGGQRLTAALEQLDVMISLDIYLNETTRHADVILPGPSPLEESHYDVFFSQFAHRNVARFSAPALPKPPDILEDWQTMARLVAVLSGEGPDADLAVVDDRMLRSLLGDQPDEITDFIVDALGDRPGADRRVDLGLRVGPYGDQFGLNPDGLTLDSVLAAPSGIDLGPLEPRIPEVLRTPSGKVELAPAPLTAALADAGRDLDAARPGCVVIGRRHLRSNNSWMHNIEVLAKGKERCTLLVNPADAEAWGVADGEPATVTAAATGASITATVQVSDEIMVGVVSLPHGWGHDQPNTRLAVAANRPGANVNALADPTDRDSLSGNPALSQTEVIVAPAASL